MNSDTAFAEEPGGNQLDPEYAALFDGIEDEEPAEREAGREALPRYDFYVFDVEAAQGDISNQKATPQGTLQLRVALGPEGTKGRVEFGRFSLTARKTKYVDGVETGLDEDEQVAELKKHRKLLVRIATELRLATRVPASLEKSDITNWLQPAIGQQIVMAAYPSKPTEEFASQTRLLFKSIANGTSARKNSKGDFVDGTCYDEAVDELAKHGQRQAKKAGGQKAGNVLKASAPTGF